MWQENRKVQWSIFIFWIFLGKLQHFISDRRLKSGVITTHFAGLCKGWNLSRFIFLLKKFCLMGNKLINLVNVWSMPFGFLFVSLCLSLDLNNLVFFWVKTCSTSWSYREIMSLIWSHAVSGVFWDTRIVGAKFRTIP